MENLRILPALGGTISDSDPVTVHLGDVRGLRVFCASGGDPIAYAPVGDTTGYTLNAAGDSGIMPWTAQSIVLRRASGSGNAVYVLQRWAP